MMKNLGLSLVWTFILLGCFCAFMNTGCNSEKKPLAPQLKYSRYYNTNRIGEFYQVYSVVLIDGCEYICYSTHGFSHKGNCTNSIHLYRTPELEKWMK